MKITEIPSKKLRTISEEVKLPLSPEDEKIAKELIEYIDLAAKEDNDLRPGVGIAAVQLGYLKKMFYAYFPMHNNEMFQELLINPVLISESEKYCAISVGEGCLSVPEETKKCEGYVHRKYRVIVKGYSYFKNEEVEYTLEGFPAIVFQHELDHLNGKLFFDRIDQKNIWKKKDGEIII